MISERAAADLVRGLGARGIAAELNDDSAGYEAFVNLPNGFTLCIALCPESSGYDWQILTLDRAQALAGSWTGTDSEGAAALAASLVAGLGSALVA